MCVCDTDDRLFKSRSSCIQAFYIPFFVFFDSSIAHKFTLPSVAESVIYHSVA